MEIKPSIMKNPLLTIACLTAATLLFAACGGPDKSAFNNAAPDVKQVWNQAIAADKANNYVAANTNYVSLMSVTLRDKSWTGFQIRLWRTLRGWRSGSWADGCERGQRIPGR
jgi:hypothetical protein